MLLLALLALLAAAPAAPASAAPSLQETVAQVAATGPRAEGSDGESALVALVTARLSAEGLSAAPFDFSSADFGHSFSTCLRVDVPGASTDTLLVAVPLDSAPGASPGRDGSLGVALALDLLSGLAGTRPPLSVTVLFLGAERGAGGAYPMGTRLFLRDFRPDARVAVLSLDVDGPGPLAVRPGGTGTLAPSWLVERCLRALRAAAVTASFPAGELPLYRRGLVERDSLVEPWLDAGFPAVGLESAAAGRAGTGEPAALAAFLRSFAADPGGIPDEWDRHWFLVGIPPVSVMVGETAWVLAFAGILAAAFLYAMAFRGRLMRYLRALGRNAFAFVPVTALTFGFLWAGTWAVEGVLRLRGFPRAWEYAPLAFLGLKGCAAMALFAGLSPLFRRLRFPRSGSFYSAAAILVLLVDMVAVGTVDITFSAWFAWAFIFVLLSTLVRPRALKAALFLPAPAWGIAAVVAAFQAPAHGFWRFLLLSPVQGNLFLAGACLPFVLVLLRLGLAFPGRGLLRRRTRGPLAAGLFLAGGAAFAAALALFQPFSPASPQPVYAVQTITVDAEGRAAGTTLALESPAPFGPLVVSAGGAATALDPGATSALLDLPPALPPGAVAVSHAPFLQQDNVTVRLSMAGQPRAVGMSLSSAEDFILLDSSFPSVRESPRAYRLLVGAQPPDPLEVEMALPAGGRFTLTVTLETDGPLVDAFVSPRPGLAVAPRVRVVRTLEIGT